MGSLGVNILLVPESEVGAGHTDGVNAVQMVAEVWRVDMLVQRETGNPTETHIPEAGEKGTGQEGGSLLHSVVSTEGQTI